METIFNSTPESSGDFKAAAADEIKSLIADVEDLVTRVAHLKESDVVRVRTRVMKAVDAAKEKLVDGADTVKRHTQKAAGDVDDYVRDNPWQAVGVAALVGAMLGILVARR